VGDLIKLDDYRDIVDVRKDQVGLKSIAVTWVEGKIIFKDDSKWAKAFFGICHFNYKIFLLTPKDWERALAIASVMVAPQSRYCEKKYVCLNFKCHLNEFDKSMLEKEFKAHAFTLGLPADVGSRPLWFNTGRYAIMWKDFAIKPEGGILRYKD